MSITATTTACDCGCHIAEFAPFDCAPYGLCRDRKGEERSVRCSHCDAVHRITSADEYDQAAALFADCEVEPGVFYVKCTAWPADWR